MTQMTGKQKTCFITIDCMAQNIQIVYTIKGRAKTNAEDSEHGQRIQTAFEKPVRKKAPVRLCAFAHEGTAFEMH